MPSFVVIGGGEVGARMARQLLRARAAGRLDRRHRRGGPRPVLRGVSLERARDASRSRTGTTGWPRTSAAGIPDAHLVPYHWAPHLLVDGWRARCGGPAATVRARRPARAPRACPSSAPPRPAIARCPTRPGRVRRCASSPRCARTPAAVATGAWPPTSSACPADPADESVVFRSLHLTYGVGTVPVREIHAARDRVLAAARGGDDGRSPSPPPATATRSPPRCG